MTRRAGTRMLAEMVVVMMNAGEEHDAAAGERPDAHVNVDDGCEDDENSCCARRRMLGRDSWGNLFGCFGRLRGILGKLAY